MVGELTSTQRKPKAKTGYTDYHFVNMRDNINYKVTMQLISTQLIGENQKFLCLIGLALVLSTNKVKCKIGASFSKTCGLIREIPYAGTVEAAFENRSTLLKNGMFI